jgi:hypothetical protein
MIPQPDYNDEAALGVMARTSQYWMRFFAPLRMTANHRKGGASAREARSLFRFC